LKPLTQKVSDLSKVEKLGTFGFGGSGDADLLDMRRIMYGLEFIYYFKDLRKLL
jgi:hypothetical protein